MITQVYESVLRHIKLDLPKTWMKKIWKTIGFSTAISSSVFSDWKIKFKRLMNTKLIKKAKL